MVLPVGGEAKVVPLQVAPPETSLPLNVTLVLLVKLTPPVIVFPLQSRGLPTNKFANPETVNP
jgi:hypothetical protein